MVKKKIDNRIRVMIENGVKLGHRSMFIIVGDKGRDQVSQVAKKTHRIVFRVCIEINITCIHRCRFCMIC